MKNSQKGFGVTSLILLGCVVAIIGLVGWFVYQNNKTVIHTTPATETILKAPTAQPQPVDNLHVTSLPDISTGGWSNFQESSGKIHYKYPSDWTFKNSGLIYYGTSEATSNNKSAIQTLVSPDGDSKADYDNNYKKLPGAQITIRAADNQSNNASSSQDYCKTQRANKFFLEELPNTATPMCLGMTNAAFYQIGASYCGIVLQASIILGGKNTPEQQQRDLQTLIGIAKSWDFKNVCATDSQGIEHLYFGP